MFFRWLSFACHSTALSYHAALRRTHDSPRPFCTHEDAQTKPNCTREYPKRKAHTLNGIFIRFKTPADCVSKTYTFVLYFHVVFLSLTLLHPVPPSHPPPILLFLLPHAAALECQNQHKTEHNIRWFKHLRVAPLIWHLCTGARLRKKENENNEVEWACFALPRTGTHWGNTNPNGVSQQQTKKIALEMYFNNTLIQHNCLFKCVFMSDSSECNGLLTQYFSTRPHARTIVLCRSRVPFALENSAWNLWWNGNTMAPSVYFEFTRNMTAFGCARDKRQTQSILKPGYHHYRVQANEIPTCRWRNGRASKIDRSRAYRANRTETQRNNNRRPNRRMVFYFLPHFARGANK